MSDQVIRGGTIVMPEGLLRADIRITGEQIEEIAPEVSGAAIEIDAHGLVVFPGIIDVHLHFNEPGRAAWEGAATGSRALAAGGGTAFFDMPLNSTPCTVTPLEFDLKRCALEAASITDFGLWGGLIPGSVPHMAEMADRGVIGFKAFLCDSGLPEFPRADDLTLFEGMREAARLGLPVAVHAENHEITSGLAKRFSNGGRRSVRDFLDSRPIAAELEAIGRSALLARETGAKLHIVHVSSGSGVALAAGARALGTDVSIETCAHYLAFTDEDVERLGAVAKCAPPLRDAAEQMSLWTHVLSGAVNVVASDHSPAPPSMKSADFWSAWGGIAGVQSTLPVLLEQGFHRRGLPLERISSLLCSEPARRFGIRNKGIEPGRDADLVLVDLHTSTKLNASDLMQRHPISPYIGCEFRGAIRRTIRRGETIWTAGTITAETTGRLIRPERTHA